MRKHVLGRRGRPVWATEEPCSPPHQQHGGILILPSSRTNDSRRIEPLTARNRGEECIPAHHTCGSSTERSSINKMHMPTHPAKDGRMGPRINLAKQVAITPPCRTSPRQPHQRPRYEAFGPPPFAPPPRNQVVIEQHVNPVCRAGRMVRPNLQLRRPIGNLKLRQHTGSTPLPPLAGTKEYSDAKSAEWNLGTNGLAIALARNIVNPIGSQLGPARGA